MSRLSQGIEVQDSFTGNLGSLGVCDLAWISLSGVWLKQGYSTGWAPGQKGRLQEGGGG